MLTSRKLSIEDSSITYLAFQGIYLQTYSFDRQLHFFQQYRCMYSVQCMFHHSDMLTCTQLKVIHEAMAEVMYPWSNESYTYMFDIVHRSILMDTRKLQESNTIHH